MKETAPREKRSRLGSSDACGLKTLNADQFSVSIDRIMTFLVLESTRVSHQETQLTSRSAPTNARTECHDRLGPREACFLVVRVFATVPGTTVGHVLMVWTLIESFRRRNTTTARRDQPGAKLPV